MKKVNIKRSIELASLAISSLGLSLIGFASSVHAASTTYYWAGTSSGLAGSGTGQNSAATGDITTTTNWSNSSSTYDNSSINAGFQNAANLVFNVGSATLSTTGTFSGANPPAGVELVSGNVTINSAGTTPFNLSAGGVIKADTAATTLIIGGLTDSGAITFDVPDVTTTVGAFSNITGPLVIKYTGSNQPSTPTMLSPTNVRTVMNSAVPLSASYIAVEFGASYGLNMAGGGSLGLGWTIQADTGSIVALVGTVPNTGNFNKGTNYVESFIGKGGQFKVTSSVAHSTTTLSSLVLSANSYVLIPDATNTLAATVFTPGTFSLLATTPGNNGTFPTTSTATSTSTSTSTGTSSSSGSGSGSSSTTTTAKTPDTGFAQLVNHPALALAITTVGSLGLLAAARYTKKNGFKISR